jgi:drug/metabolite transporter (DMT)-like permease
MTHADTPPPHRLAPRTVLALFLVILFWASAFAGIRAALSHYTPGHVVLLRFLSASATLTVYAVLARMRLPHPRDWPRITLTAFLGIAFYHTALTYGEVTVTAGAASLLIGAAPAITSVLSTIFLHERLSRWGWLGTFISFAGMTLITLGEGQQFHFEPDALLILGAAIAISTYSIIQKPLLKKYSALQLVTCFIWVGTLFILVFTPGVVAQVQSAPPEATLAAIYLGIFPAAIAYVMWSHALSQAPASIVANFLYLIPLFATVIAWFWLGEVPSLLSIAGGGIILAGVLLVSTRGMAPRPAPPPTTREGGQATRVH